MKLFAFTAAAAACAIALPAAAQGLTDPQTYLRGGYVELEGGSPFQGATTEFNSVEGLGTDKGSGHLQAGYFGGAIFGHNLAPGVALELEGVWFKNRYRSSNDVTEEAGGSTRTYGGLANFKLALPYDYHIAQRFALVPYVAVGAGYGDVRYNTGYDGETLLDDSRSGLIWQTKAGIEVKTGTPLSFDFGYRYMETPEYHADNIGGTGDSFQLKTHVQTATGGVKWTF